MSVRSMTGFGTATTPDGTWVVDVRSVNGRFLDLSLRLPDEWRGLEPALRERVSRVVKRGKVELRIGSAAAGSTATGEPSDAQLERLARLDERVRRHLPQARSLSVHEALGWAKSTASPARLADDELLAAADAALEALVEARGREGARLAAVLQERLAYLHDGAARARPLIAPAIERQRQRFLQRWQEALAAAGAPAGQPSGPPGAEAAQDRALSEAAAYALRIDVAEELERLTLHLQEIKALLQAGGDLGKRLDFLIQELHREANTLGSKSASMELTGISVDLRVAIEQMREQVQNIE